MDENRRASGSSSREGMKTIRQIAMEIGVSKQAVYKRVRGKLFAVCAPYVHTEHGVLFLDEQGEMLIKRDFLLEMDTVERPAADGVHTESEAVERSADGAHMESETVEYPAADGAHTESEAVEQKDDIVIILRSAVETLQEQLAAKDQQLAQQARTIEQQAQTIAQLTEALTAAQTMAATAQALHAGTIQNQLQASAPEKRASEQKQKRGWFSKIFGRS